MAKQKMKAVKKTKDIKATFDFYTFFECKDTIHKGSTNLLVIGLGLFLVVMTIWSNPLPSLITIIGISIIDFILNTIKWIKLSKKVLNQ